METGEEADANTHDADRTQQELRKLTGPAWTEAMNESDLPKRWERAKDNAVGVGAELGVEPESRIRSNEFRLSFLNEWMGLKDGMPA